jgi:hypothetical protein
MYLNPKDVLVIRFKIDPDTQEIVPYYFRCFDQHKELKHPISCEEIVEYANVYYKKLLLEHKFMRKPLEIVMELDDIYNIDIVELYKKVEEIEAKIRRGDRLTLGEYATKVKFDFATNPIIYDSWHNYIKTTFGEKAIGQTKKRLYELLKGRVFDFGEKLHKPGKGRALVSLIYNENYVKELKDYLKEKKRGD